MTDTLHHGCHVEPVAPQTVSSGRPTGVIRMAVKGMGCPNCAMRVRNALVCVDGVLEADVALDPPVAHVRYEFDRVSEENLLRAVSAAGQRTHHRYRAWVLA